jgi:6-phosphofructokinase
MELTPTNTADYDTNFASYIRTSRANPTKDDQTLQNCIDNLKELGISYLITIGGYYTATSTMALSEASGGTIKVCIC